MDLSGKARTAFNEVHAPCCAYHYADVVEESAHTKPDETKESAGGTTLRVFDSIAAGCLRNLSGSLEAVAAHDKSTAIKKLYRLIACALFAIDNIEGRAIGNEHESK